MSSSEVLKELYEIKKQWRQNTFQVSPETRARYLELMDMRRERVRELYAQGRVIEPGTMQS
jgi:hypothetical protein